MKKLLLLTIMLVLLSSQAKASCIGVQPIRPVSPCNGQWVSMCSGSGMYSNWQWVCMNRNGY